MSNTLPRYQPSGLFRPLSLILLLVIPAGGALVAWIYQLLINVIPFIYVNFLLCAGFLTVEEKRQTKDKKGKVEEASSQLVEHVTLKPEQRAALEARLAGPPAA